MKHEKLLNRPMIVDRAKITYAGSNVGHVLDGKYSIVGFYVLYVLGKSGFKKGTRICNLREWDDLYHKRHNDIKATLLDQDILSPELYRGKNTLNEDVRDMYIRTLKREHGPFDTYEQIEDFVIRWFREKRDIEVKFINEYQ